MGRLQFWLVGCLLLMMENGVEGSRCCPNRTLKLSDDQMQALQNSIRTIVNNDCCCNTCNIPVGFHVYMGSYKTYTRGVVWVYDKVVTDTHNAYNAATGKFVVPERGLYIFSYGTLSDPGKMSHAGLYVNGIVKSWQGCNNSGGKRLWLSCSNSVTLLLQKNDVIYVADYYSTALVRTSFTYLSGAQLN